MKRNLFLACLLLISAVSVAQIVDNIGIKTGLSLASQSTKTEGLPFVPSDERYSYNPGFSIYLTSDIFNSEYTGLTIDFGYIQKGVILDAVISDDVSSSRVVTDLDFLSLNFLGNLKLPLGDFQPYIIAGPRLDFFLNYNKYDQSPSASVFDYHPVMFGITYGVGTNYILSDFIIGLEVVHQPDFTNFNDFESDRVLYTSSYKTKNKAFAFLLSVRYKLGK